MGDKALYKQFFFILSLSTPHGGKGGVRVEMHVARGQPALRAEIQLVDPPEPADVERRLLLLLHCPSWSFPSSSRLPIFILLLLIPILQPRSQSHSSRVRAARHEVAQPRRLLVAILLDDETNAIPARAQPAMHPHGRAARQRRKRVPRRSAPIQPVDGVCWKLRAHLAAADHDAPEPVHRRGGVEGARLREVRELHPPPLAVGVQVGNPFETNGSKAPYLVQPEGL